MLTVVLLFGLLVAGVHVAPSSAAISPDQQKTFNAQIDAYINGVTADTEAARESFQGVFDAIIAQANTSYSFAKITDGSNTINRQILEQFYAQTAQLNSIAASVQSQYAPQAPLIFGASYAQTPEADTTDIRTIGTALLRNAEQMWQNQSSADAALLANETQQWTAIYNAMAAQIPPQTSNDSYSNYCISGLKYTLTLLYQVRQILWTVKHGVIMNDLNYMVLALDGLHDASLLSKTPEAFVPTAIATFNGGVLIANQSLSNYFDDRTTTESSIGVRIRALVQLFYKVA